MRCLRTPSPAETLRPGSSRMCRPMPLGAGVCRGLWTRRGRDLGASPQVTPAEVRRLRQRRTAAPGRCPGRAPDTRGNARHPAAGHGLKPCSMPGDGERRCTPALPAPRSARLKRGQSRYLALLVHPETQLRGDLISVGSRSWMTAGRRIVSGQVELYKPLLPRVHGRSGCASNPPAW
jgi:hypothetical protein